MGQKFSNFVVMEAVNHSKNSAVEADTTSKHGASSKSLMSRGNFLRKAYFGLAALFVCGFLYGQNVDVQVNTTGASTTKDDCAYRINGICTTEDLGGVEVSRGRAQSTASYMDWDQWRDVNSFSIKFTNYNDFNVSVIFEVEVATLVKGQYNLYGGSEKRVGTIVLRPDETRETTDFFVQPRSFIVIARRLGGQTTPNSAPR